MLVFSWLWLGKLMLLNGNGSYNYKLKILCWSLSFREKIVVIYLINSLIFRGVFIEFYCGISGCFMF